MVVVFVFVAKGTLPEHGLLNVGLREEANMPTMSGMDNEWQGFLAYWKRSTNIREYLRYHPTRPRYP